MSANEFTEVPHTIQCCGKSKILGRPTDHPWSVLLKYGRPVAKYDPWIHRATQGPAIDGPFGDQWIL